MQAKVKYASDCMVNVSDEFIRNIKTFKDSLRFAKELAGLTDLQIAQEIGIDQAQWSRIWSGKANFPDNELPRFINLCRNHIPIRWLAYIFGYELIPAKSRLELENETLKAENSRLIRDMEAIKSFFREVGFKT